jgi:hypothetical protein
MDKITALIDSIDQTTTTCDNINENQCIENQCIENQCIENQCIENQCI